MTSFLPRVCGHDNGPLDTWNCTGHGALGASARVHQCGETDAKREWQKVSTPSLPATTWASQLSTPSASPLCPLSHFLCTCLWMLAYNVHCPPCFPVNVFSSPVHYLRASLLQFVQVFLISAFSSCAPTWASRLLSEPCCLCVRFSLFYYPGILKSEAKVKAS